MTVAGALSAAIVADMNHVVCFARDGGERRWQDLLDAAARVSARLDRSEGRRWALNLEDTFEFAAALLGCWAARKTPVLAPQQMLESRDCGIPFDGVIEPAGAARTESRERVVWQQLAPGGRRNMEIAPSAELVLCTSGSTGMPKEVTRKFENVEAELAVFESLWGEHVDGARMYSTVSHRHVYGLLFGVLWPLLNRRPFARFRLEFPEQLADSRDAGQALVSSPALLKRVGHLPDCAGRWRAVFSSGGLLPADAAADTARVLGACPVEVLGSTETSGVAWRRQLPGGDAGFASMPMVETRLAEGEFLEARSPFSGQADWLRMGDRVRFIGAGRFELLGRGDHLAKIEDKRISLAEIERLLLESAWVKDVAAVGLDDGARQYVGVVVQLSPAGTAELGRLGRRAFNEALKASLRPRIERVALPRRFRYVDAVPADPQGKRQRALLGKLFGSADDR